MAGKFVLCEMVAKLYVPFHLKITFCLTCRGLIFFCLFQSEAKVIEREADKWEDINNPIVKVAKTMATQLKHMTNFIRYEGPITVSLIEY